MRWFNDDDAVKVLVLTGAGRSAQGAFQIGFVNRLAKPDALANTDQALAEPTAANDPLSMTAGKWTAMITAGYPLSESFERAVSMQMASGATLGEAITKASASVRVCERRELRLRVLAVMQLAGCQRRSEP